ncbi:MAG: YhcH/YjgK/YiaL family protein [Lachnospiraceae bacterium]|nr:YhcH/YjgK/YiaL family protein [Lachnospiraceae bacterium]
MIISSYKKLDTYKGLSKNLDTAINYLQNADKTNLEGGKLAIDGDEVYAVVSEYSTRTLDEGKYETHEKYLDIQCLLEGEEFILITNKSKLKSTGYDAVCDKENYTDGAEEVSVRIMPEVALILYPEEAHKACCMVNNEKKPVKKLLLKVKI